MTGIVSANNDVNELTAVTQTITYAPLKIIKFEIVYCIRARLGQVDSFVYQNLNE